MSKIQMVDLYHQYTKIREEIDHAIQEVINNTSFINGPQVKNFELALSTYHGVPYAVGCGNGTDALQIAMMALDLQPGDEVIVPAFTYIATAEVIALLRLKPIFVDVEYDTFNIDVSQIENRITSKTKAIVPVNLFGQCADYETITAIAKKNNLHIIEDNAQSIGADFLFSDKTTKKAGTLGDIGCLSFFPSKNLGCYGDGGAMLFNDAVLAERARMIANHGQKKKYYHEIIGCNSRLDSIQAAVLNVKMHYLNEYNKKRQKVAKLYNEAFKDVPELVLPVKNANSTHIYNQYTVKIKEINRDTVKDKLKEHEIPSMIYYPMPLHHQKAFFSDEFPAGSLPVSEKLSREVLSLPIHTELDESTQHYIIEKVIETIESLR